MIPLPVEIQLLGWSVILLFVHLMLQGQTATRDRGLDWNAGPRDGDAKPLGPLAGRAQRALSNFQETWPAFIALALAITLTGRSGSWSQLGAWIWFGARIAYIPLYLGGVKYVRSLAWLVSAFGLLLMLVQLL